MITIFSLTQLILETPKYEQVAPKSPPIVKVVKVVKVEKAVEAAPAPEPVVEPTPAPEPVVDTPPAPPEPVYTPPSYNDGTNAYPVGQCTQYVKSRRPDIPNTLGDANYWFNELASMGWAVGYTPRAGAIGQSISGVHVVYVEYVNNDGSIHLSERNWDYQGSYRERDAPAYLFKYVY